MPKKCICSSCKNDKKECLSSEDYLVSVDNDNNVIGCKDFAMEKSDE